MQNWFMLTLVGKDQPGIVAKVSETVFRAGGNLGEASMTRLGGNFTIMLMVQLDGDVASLSKALAPVCEALSLQRHVDQIEGKLHRHIDPDVRISIHGADRAGIVAEATAALAEAGLNILNLESDVAGTGESPIYIMHIEGVALQGADALENALATLAREKNVETHLTLIDTLMG